MANHKENKIITIIKPQAKWLDFGFKELWNFRELAYFFVWRDIKVRYKQTVVGVLWAIFRPFVTMIIFTIFFGNLAKMPSDGIPYPIFVYTGLLLWQYFSFTLSTASSSMVSNASIIQKIYFPRLIVPVASSLIGLVDFIVASFILMGLMFYYHYVPSVRGMFYMPLLVLITFLISVGLGSFLGAVNVKYRDVRYVTPFFIQILMFLTPVIYPVSLVENKYKWLLALNPMSGVIETARTVMFNTGSVDWQILSLSMIISALFFIFGIFYFKKTEKFFADII